MAKKDVSAIVSGMIVENVKKRGLGDDVIHQVARPEGDAPLEKFVDLIAEQNGNTSTPFPVSIDYGRRLERMIEDGRYDWKNSDINSKNFPVKGKGRGKVEVKIELVHFNKAMDSDEILKELDKQGLRPATLPELLAFGTQYPEKQREFLIVALSSVWRSRKGYRGVPSLSGPSLGRSLNLSWFGGRWFADCRFAAVRM